MPFRLNFFALAWLAASSAVAQGEYWQQSVDYTINARLNDTADAVSGTVVLRYTNNSPVAITELFFHLYQNANDAHAYRRGNYVPDSEGEHIRMENVKVNGIPVTMEFDNTMARAKLDSPLAAGGTALIAYNFSTKFTGRGRMRAYGSAGLKHYNGAHWYPRLSVFDRVFGWTTDQHLGNEFYGDFGRFDVTLELPAHYIVEATGVLQNESEVLPPALRAKLDLAQFAEKQWNSKPSEIIAPAVERKKWHYKAERVHDFAWTADPNYRLAEATATTASGKKVLCVAIAQEQHAAGWQNAASYAARIIEFYSDYFGDYEYSKMVVADAADGMEYPMLTLDGGRDPGYRDLLAHEIGHNWFYGMLGNNETYRAWMDEGFTQFATALCMAALEGDTQSTPDAGWFEKRFYQPQTYADAEVFNGYYNSALVRGDEVVLNTHSDAFEQPWHYGQVYSKTAVMLFQLKHLLGDSLFRHAMRSYVNEWKFKHPYPEDFRRSVTASTGVDLNWFFDQWLNTSARLDYALKGISRYGRDSLELVIERRGDQQMPVEFSVWDTDGNEHRYLVPNQWFEKKTDATVLPRWIGWGELNRTYTAHFAAGYKLAYAAIDSERKTADLNFLNNDTRVPVSLRLGDYRTTYDYRRYLLEWHPAVAFNVFDGVKIGVLLRGSHAQTKHVMSVGLWYSSGFSIGAALSQPNEQNDYTVLQYAASYRHRMDGLSRKFWAEAQSSNRAGWWHQRLALRWQASTKTTFKAEVSDLFLQRRGINYQLLPYDLQTGAHNAFTDFKLIHQYTHHRTSAGRIELALRSTAPGSDFNYGFLNLTAVNDNRFWKLNWRTRTVAQVGSGSYWAPESRLMAAGANAEQVISNVWERAVAWQEAQPMGIAAGNYQSGGGLGLRAYNGYLLPESNGDSLVRFGYAGHTGAALNTELEFDQILPRWRAAESFVRWHTYLFADAGVININLSDEPLAFSRLRADAGVGAAIKVVRWGRFDEWHPVTIRADFPFFMNRPPAGQSFWQTRWLVGLTRAF